MFRNTSKEINKKLPITRTNLLFFHCHQLGVSFTVYTMLHKLPWTLVFLKRRLHSSRAIVETRRIVFFIPGFKGNSPSQPAGGIPNCPDNSGPGQFFAQLRGQQLPCFALRIVLVSFPVLQQEVTVVSHSALPFCHPTPHGKHCLTPIVCFLSTSAHFPQTAYGSHSNKQNAVVAHSLVGREL